MRVLFASAEIHPLAKTGGLADVSAGLPAALARRGVDVLLAMPAYPGVVERADAKQCRIPLGNVLGHGDVSLVLAQTPDTGLPLCLVDCPSLFQRRGGLYADPAGREWPDNADRFAVLCHAAARVAVGAGVPGWRADVVHANDWHLGLLPMLLSGYREPRPATVFTIHNLAFQGLFPAGTLPRIGVPPGHFSPEGMEFYGQLSFLKAGIRYADKITTVSPSYAREIVTPEFGCGLDGVLRARADDLVGILNGIDYSEWNPDDRDALRKPYSVENMSGKSTCKEALRGELGLKSGHRAPLFAFVSRMTEQKMADILPAVVPSILQRGGQVAVCGEGDRRIEADVHALSRRYPGQVSVHIGYNDAFAKRMFAGADVVLAPARFEPCGLTQMYGMRYGALPIARRVGGLADTVRDIPANDDDETSTGFLFDAATALDFTTAIDRACMAYRKPRGWRRMQIHAMTRNFGWRRSAQRYEELYAGIARRSADRNMSGIAERHRVAAV
jgi:starch synthase